ncbi:MAG: hypothetical protein CML06_17885 [Pseudomonadales bacterium]|nr:hypothetical protein [Pseudomonadales bacterium]
MKNILKKIFLPTPKQQVTMTEVRYLFLLNHLKSLPQAEKNILEYFDTLPFSDVEAFSLIYQSNDNELNYGEIASLYVRQQEDWLA